MPADDGFGANNRQAGTPIAQTRQEGQTDPGRGIDAPRFDAALLEWRQLTPENEIFGDRSLLRSKGESDQPAQVDKQPKHDSEEGDHRFMMPHVVSWLLNRTIE